MQSRLVSSRLRAMPVRLLVGGAGVAICQVAQADAAHDAEVRSFQTRTDWTLVEGSGALDLHPEASLGDSSLVVGGSYWRRIESAQMESLGDGDPNVIQLDVRLTADGLAHWESLGMVIKAPSQGVHWLDLGQIPLGTTTAAGWTTVSFSVPSSFHAALSPPSGDLSVLRTLLRPR